MITEEDLDRIGHDFTGWHLWQSRDGARPGRWYATRTGPDPDGDPPDGWAKTVFADNLSGLQNALTAQLALDHITARRLAVVPESRKPG